jgi:carboxyl-terminal processing protease
VLLVTLALATSLGWSQGAQTATPDTPAAKTLAAVPAPPPAPPEAVAAFRHLLQIHYVTPLDSTALARATTMESLLALVRTDPFTDVYSPARWQSFSVALGQAFGGIGAVLGRIRDTLVLGDVLPDGPASEAGLEIRDRIVSIDDSAIIGWSLSHAVSRIRGAPGSTVTLGVVRRGEAKTLIRVLRASVQSPSVPAASLSPNGLGIITISQFGPDLSANLVQTIDRMRQRGLKSLILDLRGNPGGLLEEAIRVSNLFLPQGSLLVETRYRGMAPERHLAEQPSRYPSIPLAVLVGPETASASEIVAGALQDRQRAIIVGRQTYGKGLVQTSSPLAQGWMAKLTVGQWFTPAGRLIDRGIHASPDSTKPFDPDAPHTGGIVPDVVIADSVGDAADRAYKLMGKAAGAIYLALDDEVGRFLETHPKLPSTLDPVPGASSHIFTVVAKTDTLADSARAGLAAWLDAQVTQRAIEARYGTGGATIWQYPRDPQVKAAAAVLLTPTTAAAGRPNSGT